MFRIFVFSLFVLLFTADAASYEHLELSFDGGLTWVRKLPTTASLPVFVQLRLREGKSYISLPACAVEHGPASVEWRGLNALGVRDAALCSSVDKIGFQYLYADPIELVPAWHIYLHDSVHSKSKRSFDESDKDSEGVVDGSNGTKRRGFWTKYGFYIVAFICFSLIQGIREGNAQYKQEVEEAARAEAAKRSETSAKTSVTVPRRKSKAKKNTTKKSN